MSLVNLEDGYKIEEDKDGLLWVTTPRGLQFPHATRLGTKVCEKLEKNKNVHYRFMTLYPCVKEWLETFESDASKRGYATSLLDFCIFSDMTPKEFGELWRTTDNILKARAIATKWVRSRVKISANKAYAGACALKSFFRIYSSGFLLPLDTKRGGAVEIKESQKAKSERDRYDWGPPEQFKQTMNAIFANTDDLRRLTALTMLYRSGVRNNVLDHITVGDMQEVIQINGEQLLCLTITGRLDHKLRNVKMKLSTGKTGYYTYIARDGLELVKHFMKGYHSNSRMNTPVFRHSHGQPSTRYVPSFRASFKRTCKALELPYKDMWLHQIRGLFNELAHKHCEPNKAELLTGHKLPGVQEHYQKRHKTELAVEYLKINFGA